MSGYLGTLRSTGETPIDAILSAVEDSGDRYHHTEYWNDTEEGESSCVQSIQAASNSAAAALKAAREALELAKAGEEVALESCKARNEGPGLAHALTLDKIVRALALLGGSR